MARSALYHEPPHLPPTKANPLSSSSMKRKKFHTDFSVRHQRCTIILVHKKAGDSLNASKRLSATVSVSGWRGMSRTAKSRASARSVSGSPVPSSIMSVSPDFRPTAPTRSSVSNQLTKKLFSLY